MKTKILIYLILSTLCATAMAQEEEDGEFRQYTSFTLFAGPNMVCHHSSLSTAEDAPDRILPLPGLDGGGSLNYHIAEGRTLSLAATAFLEGNSLRRDDWHATLATAGIDIAIHAVQTVAIGRRNIDIAAGPFFHFVLVSHISDDIHFANPYSRIVATNPRTDTPLFALGNFNAGITLSATCPLRDQLAAGASIQYGLTNLLNADSDNLYVHPLKVTLIVEYSLR